VCRKSWSPSNAARVGFDRARRAVTGIDEGGDIDEHVKPLKLRAKGNRRSLESRGPQQVQFDMTNIEAFVLQLPGRNGAEGAVVGASENRQARLSEGSRDLESNSLVAAAD
jgi:hypothetical protein